MQDEETVQATWEWRQKEAGEEADRAFENGRASFKKKLLEANRKMVQCSHDAFAEGLYKMRDIKRVDESKWTLRSLSKRVYAVDDQLNMTCVSDSEPEYNEMTLQLGDDGNLTLRNIASADARKGTSQTWRRIEGP